jgi:Kef-type K+ transport system membrane component KefB
MEPYALFLLTIGITLLGAKFLSGIIEKRGIPGVLGEILAGIIVGTLVVFLPVVKDFIDPGTDTFKFLARIGILFLLLLAGLQTDLKTLKNTGRVATISTIGGVLVPLVLGFLVVRLFGWNDKEAFGIGVMLTATSIGITVRVMMDLGVLSSKVGTASLSASVIDDFIGIILLVLATGEGDILMIVVNMVVFVAITMVVGWFAIDKVVAFFKKFPTTRSLLAFIVALMFIFSAFAEVAFQAAIEGAFVLGIIVNKCEKGLNEDVKSVTYGFAAPLFFIYIGSIVNVTVFGQGEMLLFAAAVVACAIFGKISGRGAFARAGGFTWKESLQMGVGSVPRMEVALISLAISIDAGIFSPEHQPIAVATAMVFVTVTTLITPMLLKRTFKAEIAARLVVPQEKSLAPLNGKDEKHYAEACDDPAHGHGTLDKPRDRTDKQRYDHHCDDPSHEHEPAREGQ